MRFKLRDRIRVKRAVLKGPVREIRTQGSVRGQLGNWLFYLDCANAVELSHNILIKQGIMASKMTY